MYIKRRGILLPNKSAKKNSKPKPKLPLPKLSPCPICGSKGKVQQNEQGKECFASVHCKNKECGYGTVTRRPKDGESNRENKIAAMKEWNDGFVYPPGELKKLNDKAKQMHKKEKKQKRQLNNARKNA